MYLQRRSDLEGGDMCHKGIVWFTIKAIRNKCT